MTNVDEAIAAIRAADEPRLRELVAIDPKLGAGRDTNGVSLLMLACYFRQQAMVSLLRSAAGDLDIFEAATLGDVNRLESLLDAEPALIQTWSADGFQAIHLASFFV